VPVVGPPRHPDQVTTMIGSTGVLLDPDEIAQIEKL
jgi:hypothetical protein